MPAARPAACLGLALALSLACGGAGGSSDGVDTALSSLTVSAGTLSPPFSPETVVYRLDLPDTAGTLTFTPTARDPGAKGITVAVDGGAPVAVGSGRTSPPFDAPWPGGHANATISVTAANGNVRTYTVAMMRATGFCGASAPVAVVDPALPPVPTIPAPCGGAVLDAAYTVDAGTGLPVFTPPANHAVYPDTTRIQAAIDACTASLSPGQQGSVKLQVAPGDATRTAFVSGPLTLKANVTLWVDAGATLFASRDPRQYDRSANSCAQDTGSSSGCTAFLTVKGSSPASPLVKAGIMGRGTIDGLGGEPMIGGFGGDANASWWDFANAMDALGHSFSNPRLIDVTRAQDFTLYQITLQNSPKFHVGLGSDRFVVWGVTIHTPSRATNSVGRALSPALARNTDGIDPYDANDGWIVFSTISTGDDQIALKCGDTHLNDPVDTTPSCRNLTIAHNHFGTGHGMSVGSEINAGKGDGTGVGVDGLHVYDLSIDGLLPTGGAGNSNLNGLRIKSDPSRGGIVRNVVYEDVCMRGLANPILLNPRYDAGATGSALPTFESVTLRNVRHVDCSAAASVPAPVVTLNGYDASHVSGVTLDGVIVDGIGADGVRAQYASVVLGPGPVDFTPAGTGVTVSRAVSSSTAPNDCAGKFVAMPWAR